MGIANSFSGGIFMCVALLHLLPESAEIFHDYHENHSIHNSPTLKDHSHESDEERQFPTNFLLAFLGYTLILMIEKIIFDSHTHEIADEEEEDSAAQDEEKLVLETDTIDPNFQLKQLNALNTANMNFNNFTLNSKNLISPNNKRNTYLTTVEENPFNLHNKKSPKDSNNLLFNNANYNTKYAQRNMSFSIKESVSKASNKKDKINNYLSTFKINSDEKKEEYFKSLFTTSGRISSLLIVNDRI